MSKKDRKPFSETKVGGWLKNKFPDVLQAAGDVTGIEAFEVVARLIDGKSMSEADRLEWEKLKHQHEREMFGLHVENTDSARKREAAVVESLGKPDYAQWTVGVIGMVCSCAVIYVGLFEKIEDREVYFHLLGVIEGAMLLSIFNYYFGSSAGSKEKTRMIRK